MATPEEMEKEIKKLIIDTLVLDNLTPEEIVSDAPLFREGLGLDSVDALELGVALQKRYKVKIDASSSETKNHFASVKNLAAFVADQLDKASETKI